jgi:hypothetical protein
MLQGADGMVVVLLLSFVGHGLKKLGSQSSLLSSQKRNVCCGPPTKFARERTFFPKAFEGPVIRESMR